MQSAIFVKADLSAKKKDAAWNLPVIASKMRSLVSTLPLYLVQLTLLLQSTNVALEGDDLGKLTSASLVGVNVALKGSDLSDPAATVLKASLIRSVPA